MQESSTASKPTSQGVASAEARALRLSGLPLSVLYDKTNFSRKVSELLCGAFGLSADGIETIRRKAVMQDGQEVTAAPRRATAR